MVLPVQPARDRLARGAPLEQQLRRLLAANLAALTRLLPFQAAAERDVARRARMMALPEQLAAVGEEAAGFAGALSAAGRFDQQMLLRGVFLTAAGSDVEPAPVHDAWEARFAVPLGLRVAGTPVRDPVRAEGDPCFFVHGLFRDVIFPQAGLVGRNPRAERRIAAVFLGAYALCILTLLITGWIWIRDYQSRQALLGRMRDSAAVEKTLLANADPNGGLAAVLPLLDQARATARLAGVRDSLARDLGLSPLNIEAARAAATESYRTLLLSRLLPLLQRDLAGQLRRAAESGAGAGTLRPLLTVYLMLGDPAHYARGPVAAWANQWIDSNFALAPDRRNAATEHLQTLLSLLPAPVALDGALVSEVRSRLRQSPDADLIYARLKQEALRGDVAQPLDVVGSLGPAAAQLLMLRSQAGLPVTVPALTTRDGFYRIFIKRAPELVRVLDANDWVMGPDGDTDPAVAGAVLQQVSDLYVNDYVKQWQAVLSQLSLQALPDMPSLTSGLQTLSGPDSPLVQFIQLVKTQTDLGVPTAPPTVADKAAAAAGKEGGTVVEQAVQAAASKLSAGSGAFGAAAWPGDAIRKPFLPLQALVSASSSGGQPPVLRVQDTLVAAYGVISGIASAQDPGLAAQQAAAKVISGQGADPLIGLRVQAATLPRPIDGIFRALYQSTWSVLLRMTREQIQATWARSVAPVCENSIGRRYPFGGADAAGVDVTLQDFSNFFGRNGVIDSFINNDLAPFTTPGPSGTLTLSAQNGLSLGLSAQAMDQINRARRIRDLFFGAAGNPQLDFAMVPAYLDPRAVSAVLSVDQTRLDYRHQPPRMTQFQWPPVNTAGAASLVLTAVDGQTPELHATGPWAIFRLLGQAQRSTPGGNTPLLYSFNLSGYQASFGLRASSVVNPFATDDFMEFRCVPRL
ncbi:MAG: type VI secretion system membrane subunit TssM [Proteobacteria bacterium]|nr:type VI secretion system membrane subunit TssM [Pseudomonadota bacterium]